MRKQRAPRLHLLQSLLPRIFPSPRRQQKAKERTCVAFLLSLSWSPVCFPAALRLSLSLCLFCLLRPPFSLVSLCCNWISLGSTGCGGRENADGKPTPLSTNCQVISSSSPSLLSLCPLPSYLVVVECTYAPEVSA